MGADWFLTLYEHHCWARDKLLVCAGRFGNEPLTASQQISHGNVLALMSHMVASESAYRAMWEGNVADPPSRQATLPTLVSIVECWHLEEHLTLEGLRGLSDSDLARTVAMENDDGAVVLPKVWHLVTQLLMHSAQHRSELAVALTQLGCSPGNLDFTSFILPTVRGSSSGR